MVPCTENCKPYLCQQTNQNTCCHIFVLWLSSRTVLLVWMGFFELHSDEHYDRIDDNHKYVSDYIDSHHTAVGCTSKPMDLYEMYV